MAAREARASRHTPISHLGPDGCLVTKDGDLVAALEITRGVSHETAGQDVIDQLLDERAHLLTTIAGGDLGLWAHVTRRRITLEGDGAQEEGGAGFAAALDRAWLETLDERGLYETRRFLTLVVRPPVYERWRRVIRHAGAMVAEGRVEHRRGVTHLLVRRVHDLGPEIAAAAGADAAGIDPGIIAAAGRAPG